MKSNGPTVVMMLDTGGDVSVPGTVQVTAVYGAAISFCVPGRHRKPSVDRYGNSGLTIYHGVLAKQYELSGSGADDLTHLLVTWHIPGLRKGHGSNNTMGTIIIFHYKWERCSGFGVRHRFWLLFARWRTDE